MAPACFAKGCPTCHLRDWCGDYCRMMGKTPRKDDLPLKPTRIKPIISASGKPITGVSVIDFSR